MSERVLILGVQIAKSADLTGISDYKHTHYILHLHGTKVSFIVMQQFKRM